MPANELDVDNDADVTEPMLVDLDWGLRSLDDVTMPDTGGGLAPIVDIGAYERVVPGDAGGDREFIDEDIAPLLAALTGPDAWPSEALFGGLMAGHTDHDRDLDTVDMTVLQETYGL